MKRYIEIKSLRKLRAKIPRVNYLLNHFIIFLIDNQPSSPNEAMSNNENLLKVVYFSSIAGIATLFGFSTTLGRLRKDAPLENSSPKSSAQLHQEGVALARKALFRATIYTVTGFSTFMFISYQLFGKRLLATKAEEFRQARERGVDLSELKFLFGSEESKSASRGAE